MATIDVKTAGLALAQTPDHLATIGIGSCVAVCLYDSRRRAGALLHIMLPRAEGDITNPLRYADTALNTAIEQLLAQGSSNSKLWAKISGGAQMFPALGGLGTIGERNATEVKRILSVMGIALVSQDIGGSSG